MSEYQELMCDCRIVGGGINCLLLARELAKAQAKVVLIERHYCGMEASWAGGGIVSPLYPWKYSAGITALASWAQDFYPALVAELENETGIDAQLQPSGLLMLDTEDEAQALAWAQSNGRRMERLGSAAIYSRAANLKRIYRSALWMPDVANVRNPRLVKALVESLKSQANVRILEQAELKELEKAGDRIAACKVHSEAGTQRIVADAVIVSAGAWSGTLLEAAGIRLPITPVKGQMLLFKLPPHTVNTILLTSGRYLIPRRDGYLLAGSTLEYCGFDKTATDEARDELLASARALLPELTDISPVKHWAGLRPGAPQGMPFIGIVPPYSNLYINAGQFRNGLVLAPASARLLADNLLGRRPILDPEPYLPATRMPQR